METTTQASEREEAGATPGSPTELVKEARGKTHRPSSAKYKTKTTPTMTRTRVFGQRDRVGRKQKGGSGLSEIEMKGWRVMWVLN